MRSRHRCRAADDRRHEPQRLRNTYTRLYVYLQEWLKNLRYALTSPTLRGTRRSSTEEFSIYSDIVNQACCSEGAACPPGGIPTSCTADCAAVLLPMQATCAEFLSLIGMTATVDAAVATCPAECPADTRAEECVTADREAVAEALCHEWGFHWDAARKTCTAGGH